MASEKDQYANLFGSSDEESGDEDDVRAPPSAAAASAPAPAPAATAAAGSSDEESSAAGGGGGGGGGSSSGSSDESEEDDRPVRKRLSKGKKGRVVRKAAASSGESSDEEEEEEGGRKGKAAASASSAAAAAPAPARSRATGLSALDRATADFAEPESSDEEGGGGEGASKPFVARSVSSGSSSGSGSDADSSDDEGDSRRRKRLQKKKKGAAGAGRKRGAGKARAAKGSDESGEDSDRGGRGDRGGGASSSSSRRPGRELTVVEQALQKLKRNRGAKLPEKEVQERTTRLIELMEAAAKEDRLALQQGRPGLSKMAHLQEVLDLLRSKHLQGALVDNGQLLGLIKLWIQPLPDKSLPLYSVRTPLIEYLVSARVEVHRLKESGIGAVIQKLKKHPNETLENKARLGEIIDNWSRLITGKGTHVKTEYDQEGNNIANRGGAGAPGGDGYIYAKTSRGVEIPIRPGFNFKKVAMSFKGVDDRGHGKDDEALEVNEREPRGDGVESRTSKVRRALKDMGRKGSGKRLRAENVSHSGL